MDISTVKDALGLDITASDTEVLGKIAQLRQIIGEETEKDLVPPDLRLLRAGSHPQCAVNPDGSMVMTLLAPIKFGKDSIAELNFKRPTMKDLRVAQKAGGEDFAGFFAMLCSLTGHAESVLEKMDVADVDVCISVCRFLRAGRPPTGQR